MTPAGGDISIVSTRSVEGDQPTKSMHEPETEFHVFGILHWNEAARNEEIVHNMIKMPISLEVCLYEAIGVNSMMNMFTEILARQILRIKSMPATY